MEQEIKEIEKQNKYHIIKPKNKNKVLCEATMHGCSISEEIL